MKRLFITCLSLTLGCVCAMAQINLREGIVITLQGDTLHGDIDYRTDVINAKQCVFIADKSTEYKTYKPGEISGYRFLDNGRYYVSKQIAEDSLTNVKTYAFLEYVIKGTLSFYYMSDVSTSHYFLEDENGKMAKFSNISEMANSVERREQLADAFPLVCKSQMAQKMLWGTQTTKNNVKKLTLRYNKDVCPDGQCEVFEYRAKKVPKDEKYVHWTLKAGYSPILYRRQYYVSTPSVLCPGYRISGGMEAYLTRLYPGLFVQASLEYSQTFNEDVEKVTYKGDYHYQEASFKLGVGYEFSLFTDKLKGRVFAGKDAGVYKHETTVNANYHFTDKTDNYKRSYYYGAGLTYPMGRHQLLLECQLYYKYKTLKGWPTRRPSIMIGYQF